MVDFLFSQIVLLARMGPFFHGVTAKSGLPSHGKVTQIPGVRQRCRVKPVEKPT